MPSVSPRVCNQALSVHPSYANTSSIDVDASLVLHELYPDPCNLESRNYPLSTGALVCRDFLHINDVAFDIPHMTADFLHGLPFSYENTSF